MQDQFYRGRRGEGRSKQGVLAIRNNRGVSSQSSLTSKGEDALRSKTWKSLYSLVERGLWFAKEQDCQVTLKKRSAS